MLWYMQCVELNQVPQTYKACTLPADSHPWPEIVTFILKENLGFRYLAATEVRVSVELLQYSHLAFCELTSPYKVHPNNTFSQINLIVKFSHIKYSSSFFMVSGRNSWFPYEDSLDYLDIFWQNDKKKKKKKKKRNSLFLKPYLIVL